MLVLEKTRLTLCWPIYAHYSTTAITAKTLRLAGDSSAVGTREHVCTAVRVARCVCVHEDDVLIRTVRFASLVKDLHAAAAELCKQSRGDVKCGLRDVIKT